MGWGGERRGEARRGEARREGGEIAVGFFGLFSETELKTSINGWKSSINRRRIGVKEAATNGVWRSLSSLAPTHRSFSINPQPQLLANGTRFLLLWLITGQFGCPSAPSLGRSKNHPRIAHRMGAADASAISVRPPSVAAASRQPPPQRPIQSAHRPGILARIFPRISDTHLRSSVWNENNGPKNLFFSREKRRRRNIRNVHFSLSDMIERHGLLFVSFPRQHAHKDNLRKSINQQQQQQQQQQQLL